MIERPDYGEKGGRYVSCTRCGMGWLEYREPVELFPGEWTTAGEREHQCPLPYDYETARAIADTAVACGGIVTSQRMKARVKLGLELGP